MVWVLPLPTNMVSSRDNCDSIRPIISVLQGRGSTSSGVAVEEGLEKWAVKLRFNQLMPLQVGPSVLSVSQHGGRRSQNCHLLVVWTWRIEASQNSGGLRGPFQIPPKGVFWVC